MSRHPRLLPNGPEGEPVFKSRAQAEKFRRDFYESIKPSLDRFAAARHASNEFAKTKYVT